MKRELNIDAILVPIEGDNPAGKDLRYELYDDIKELRREEEPDEFTGNKGRSADWNKVIDLTVEALEKKSKDLQIAAWLSEALIATEGFDGLSVSLKIMTGLLKDYWENVYPLMDEGDLEYRMGPLEFLNEKLSYSVKHIPVTEKKGAQGYSWFTWNESRKVGYENDPQKSGHRSELISEGKISPEDFDAAAVQSSEIFCVSLIEKLKICNELFKTFDETVDEKFGVDNAPRLAEIRGAIEDCELLVKDLYKDKVSKEPNETVPTDDGEAVPDQGGSDGMEENLQSSIAPEASAQLTLNKSPDGDSMEKAVWQEALKALKSGGINIALKQLYDLSSSEPSVRGKNRYRLLMAKLCLKAGRPDLARPIIEELSALIEELQLERWESPMWIAEVLETLYKCLTAGTPSDDDMQRAEELFKRICKTDVTKAMAYKV